MGKAELPQGDKGELVVKLNRLWPDIKGPVQVGLMQSPNRPGEELPQNLRFNNNQPVTINANQNEAKMPVTVGPDVPPGAYSVVLRGQTQVAYNKDPMSKQKPNVQVVAVSLPVTVSVLPKTLATLSLSNANPTLKIGKEAELQVRVVRRFNYGGELKVQVVLPPNVKGVEAPEVTIPAGANEAKLVLRSPEGSMPGFRGNLTLKATAVFNGKVPVVHEIKFNVNVVK